MSVPATCNHLTAPDAAGRQIECGRAARWVRNLLIFCDDHAREASVRAPFREIGGPGELDRRPRKRIIRKYHYPRRD
jgi:hypothetical protein